MEGPPLGGGGRGRATPRAPAFRETALPAPFSATLFLYFDQELSGEGSPGEMGGTSTTPLMLQRTLIEAWNSLPHHRCFAGGLRFLDNRKGELNHVEGSCVMFYDLFAKLEQQHYQHFMWMEPDVLPVQKNWLERLTEEVADNTQCQRWWIKGSNPSLCQLVWEDQ